LGGLEIVDAAIIAIESATEYDAKFLAFAEALADIAVKPTESATAMNGRISSLPREVVRRPFTGSWSPC
jgi:hypothetical protein